jgi:hypothetical protein
MLKILSHWKLVLHLLLGTKRFGVNNCWSERFDSLFCVPLFGFGYPTLFRPWTWPSVMKVLRLRMEIAGWR